MRPPARVAFAGALVLMLFAAVGLAAVSIGDSPDTPLVEELDMPDQLRARVAAALFAGRIQGTSNAGASVTTEPRRLRSAAAEPYALEPGLLAAPLREASVPSSPTPSTTAAAPTTTTRAPTTTVAPPTTAAATTTAAPTTTTAAPTTTTTTTAAPTTTTTTTTAAPTTTTTTTVPPVEGGERDGEEWRWLVERYFPEARVDEAIRVINCESNGDPLATNPYSAAAGLFQFIPSTWGWASSEAGWVDNSPYEPEANVAVAAWLVQISIDVGQDAWHHWACKP